TLRALTLRNGSSGSEPYGGAVLMQGGSGAALSIDGVEFVDNFADQQGGAIFARAAIVIENSLFAGSQLSDFLDGGHLTCINGSLTARNTTFSPTRPGSLDGSPARSSLYINVNCPARLVNTTVVDPETYWALTVNGTLSLTNTAVVSRMEPIVGALDAASSLNNFVRGDGEIAGLVDGVNGNQVS